MYQKLCWAQVEWRVGASCLGPVTQWAECTLLETQVFAIALLGCPPDIVSN